MTKATEKLRISVPGDAKYVSTVRLTVSSVANHAGLDIEAIEDVKVAVSEACNNIINHSGIGEEAYDVICAIEGDKFEITVEDSGIGYDHSAYAEPDLGAPKESGLGLFIMRSLMDDVSVVSRPGSGTSIRMVKYRSIPSQ